MGTGGQDQTWVAPQDQLVERTMMVVRSDLEVVAVNYVTFRGSRAGRVPRDSACEGLLGHWLQRKPQSHCCF